MEFPRLVYRSASSYKLVNDDEQYSEAIKEGWFDSVPDAEMKNTIEQKPVHVEEPAQKVSPARGRPPKAAQSPAVSDRE